MALFGDVSARDPQTNSTVALFGEVEWEKSKHSKERAESLHGQLHTNTKEMARREGFYQSKLMNMKEEYTWNGM